MGYSNKDKKNENIHLSGGQTKLLTVLRFHHFWIIGLNMSRVSKHGISFSSPVCLLSNLPQTWHYGNPFLKNTWPMRNRSLTNKTRSHCYTWNKFRKKSKLMACNFKNYLIRIFSKSFINHVVLKRILWGTFQNAFIKLLLISVYRAQIIGFSYSCVVIYANMKVFFKDSQQKIHCHLL